MTILMFKKVYSEKTIFLQKTWNLVMKSIIVKFNQSFFRVKLEQVLTLEIIRLQAYPGVVMLQVQIGSDRHYRAQ